VIADFVTSWPLFQNAYLVGWLLAGLLALIGVLVVARDQIFIGAAVAQASTLGIAVAMELGDALAAAGPTWLRADGFLLAMAVAGSALAALLTARGGTPGGMSHEALTGWVFLVSSSVSVLIVSHSPHGLEEIHRLLSSSIIGATSGDLVRFALLALVTTAVLVGAHRRLLLLAMDPAMAAAVGVRVGAWSAATALWLGVVVGFAIPSAGVLYTFGCLVLPALAARNLCREVRPMFAVAPAVAIGCAVVAFVVAHHWDYPPAQMTVALLCVLALATGVRRRAGAAALLALAMLSSCARGPALPPPPVGIERIAVAPPENRTGRALVVGGAWLVDRMLGRPRTTVEDVMGAAAAAALARQGFTVVAPGAAGASTLRLAIERWEPDLPELTWVMATVEARVEPPAAGPSLWTGRIARRLVPTRDSASLGDAYTLAARAVVDELLAGWGPTSPRAAPPRSSPPPTRP
jgi:ABC-type Mn2+/Zn2+ transport system permease subunit